MGSKRNIIFGAGTIIALISGLWFGQIFFDQQDTAEPIRAMVPETSRKLAFPALRSEDGGTFDATSLTGKWSLLFFGYTHCPDVCPTTLASVAQVKKDFEQKGNSFPQVVFISIDPQRDNVDLLGDYVRYFDKDFIGVTGEEKLLRAITVQVDSKFFVEPSENEKEYAVGHSLNLVLINPEVELVAILRSPHTVKTISDALEYFLD